MNLQGGCLQQTDPGETAYTAIDIFDQNELIRNYQAEGDNYYNNPGYLRGGRLNSFFKDDIKIVACGYSSNSDFVNFAAPSVSTPIITLFRSEMLDPLWTKQYRKSAQMPSGQVGIDLSGGIPQCIFSPSGSYIIAQFISDVAPLQNYKQIVVIAVISSSDGSLLKALSPQVRINTFVQQGFEKEFWLSMASDSRLFAIYRLNYQIASLVMFNFNPILSDTQIKQDASYTATRIIEYQTVPSSITMNPEHLISNVQLQSPDKKNIYIGGATKSMSSIIKWSVSSNKVDWKFLAQVTAASSNSLVSIDIILMASGLNITKDQHQIVYCARAHLQNLQRNLFGYVLEKKYSKGGEPLLQKSVMIDAETKGRCQDIYLDMRSQIVSMFVSQKITPPMTYGRNLILQIPLNLSQNITIKALSIGSQIPIQYGLNILNNNAVKLTGLQRAMFAGKTITWDGSSSRMGFISTFPTTFRMTHDPLTIDIALLLNPSYYVQLDKDSADLLKLVPSPVEIQFLKAYVEPSAVQSYGGDNSPPFVGIPSQRLSFSMEGELYYKYTVGADPLLIGLKFYEIGPCYDIQLDYILEIEPETPSDSIITYDGVHIRIYTTMQFNTGGYHVKVTANTPNRVNKTAEFFVRIGEMKINPSITTAYSAPYFEADLVRTVNVTYQCTKIYKLPAIIDTTPNGKVNVQFVTAYNKGLPAFITYLNNKLIIAPTQSIDVGIHTLTIILSNSNKQTHNYTLYVQVVPIDPYAYREQSIIIDTSQRNEYNIQSKKENFPKAKILKIDHKGEVTVKLDQKGTTVKIKITEDHFLFVIDPPQKLEWVIKEDRQNDSIIIIQLKFENSQTVSMSALYRSQLQMFFKPSIGLEDQSGMITQNQANNPLHFYQDNLELPVQLESEKMMSFFDRLGSTFKSIATTILTSNLSVTLLLSCSMQLLWSFVNSMQLLSLIPLMTLNIPSNLYYVCSLISGPLSFKIIDVSGYTKSWFSLKSEYEPYNQHFASFGFQNTMLILELQASLYILMLTPVVFLIIFGLQKCQHKHLQIRKVAKKLKGWMRYSFYIRLLIEEFIIVFIISIINVTVGRFSSWGEIFSFSLSILMICLTISLPFILAVYILRNKQTIKGRRKIGKRLGSIYEDVRKDSAGRLLFSVIYILRRLVFCISVLFIHENPMFQILLFHMMSIIQFVYIGLWKPFENPLQNKIELLNESFVLIVSILMPGFTDYLDDDTGNTQNVLGWVVLGLLGMNCSINILIQIKDLLRKIRKIYWKIRSIRFFSKWTRVKMMSETQSMSRTSEQSKHGSRKQSETFNPMIGMFTKELDVVPLSIIPTHEQQYSRGIGIESLQLFTPRGKNLLDRNTPLYLNSDINIQEIREEEKEEDILYDEKQRFQRATTANEYPPKNRTRNHLQQLDEVSNLHNLDDFFTKFSILPLENHRQQAKFGNSMIKIKPSKNTQNNLELETLDPQSLPTQQKLDFKDKWSLTNPDQQLTTLNNNNQSTYLTTVPHQQQSALQQLMSHQSPYRDYLMGVPADQAVDRLYEILNSRLGSSSEGSSGSGESQKESQQRMRSPKGRKKNASRIKQYDENK